MGKIYFYTIAYNAEKTLARCVDSVLNQTKYGENIEYWFCENGSTDRTREMIEEYARNDSRIKLFYNEENNKFNQQSSVALDLATLLKEDDCLCWLDSDDEYKLDFLEKMIPFISENDLELAMAGSDFIDAKTGKVNAPRALDKALILDTPSRFSDHFSLYHKFARTLWGKIFTGKIANRMYTINNCPAELLGNVSVGGDTLFTFSALRHCKRVGIYPGTLHIYYESPKSLSYKWDDRKFNSCIVLNETFEEFLKRFGPISERNRIFLDRVYANSVLDSLALLCRAQGMTVEDKLKELRKVADYRVTSDMMVHKYDDIEQCRKVIFDAALDLGSRLGQENEDFRAAVMLVCPNCAPFVSADELELYKRDDELKRALFNDDMTKLVDRLLNLISKASYVNKCDLPKMIRKFSVGRGLAEEITDVRFIKAHSDIFFFIWQKKYFQALDKMTETLQKEDLLDETFLQIYLSLAAILESVDEFVFGKIKLATYYCDKKKSEECRAVLDDLADMGVEDNEEILKIRSRLNKM